MAAGWTTFLVLALPLAPGAVAAENSPLPTPLIAGRVVEREIRKDEVHRYSIELRAGEYVQLLLEQRDADIVQTVAAPDGAAVLETTCLCMYTGPSPLALVAAHAGVHELTLKANAIATPPAGRYGIRVERIGEPSPEDLLRVQAVAAVAAAEKTYRSDRRFAYERYGAALAAWRELGEPRMQMWAEMSVGVMAANGFDDYDQALVHYRRALALALELGDEFAEARLRFNIGQSLTGLGQLEEGQSSLERALDLHRTAGRHELTAQALSALGGLLVRVGDTQQALDFMLEALQLVRSSGNERRQAVTRSNVGELYLKLRDPQLALEHLRPALAPLTGDSYYRARISTSLGIAHLQLGDVRSAREALHQALEIYATTGNRLFEARAEVALGDVHHEEGDLPTARRYFESALAAYRARNDVNGMSMSQCRLGEVLRRSGDLDAARASFEAARSVASPAERWLNACAEAGLAHVASEAGELAAARDHAEKALAGTESLRDRLAGHHGRQAAFASQQSLYELLVEVLMRHHDREPAGGYDRAAFETSERARARSLLEMLAEAAVDIREGADPVLLTQERALRQRLNLKAGAQAEAALQGRGPQAQVLARDLDSLAAQLAELEGRLRRTNPRYAELTRPQPLSLAEVQARVVDGDTQLVQYSLGKTASYVWVVSADHLQSFRLPPRAQIEAAARRVHEQMAGVGARTTWAAAAEELSRLILAPAAPALRARRLALVVPGALQYVPFAALPVGGSASRVMADRFEVVTSPSASVIAALRREERPRGQAMKAAAVFADPVFERSDPRLARGSGSTGVAARPASAISGAPSPGQRALPLPRPGNPVRLGRLPFSRREADAIAGTAGRGSLKALGFEASRRRATSPDLADYRFVHFATHGVLDTARPELSGIVLSLFDEQGRPQDGFLRLHDVYNLRLGADLVVLSGCRTGLGKELRGEGLVGLTRGFLYAGARAVLASLWQVDDESTAELMGLFYRGVLQEGRAPADALRAAQLEMRKSRRWSDPFHWAGFVLQGDWR